MKPELAAAAAAAREDRFARAVAMLRSSPNLSNRAISAAAGCSQDVVAEKRRALESAGEIKRVLPSVRTNVSGRVGSSSHGASGDLITEIKQLAERGMSGKQIAKKLGISQGTVSNKARSAGLLIRADRALGRSHTLNPVRVFEESVSLLAATACSVERIKTITFRLDRENAVAMLRELSESQWVVQWMIRQLRRAIDEPENTQPHV